jgi:hypothetical protein
MGRKNIVSGCESTVSGYCNTASANCSSIWGGKSNIASGVFSSIMGGTLNSTNLQACAMIVGSNITADRSCATFVNNLSIKNIPISSVGLPSGSVWSNAGNLAIVP